MQSQSGPHAWKISMTEEIGCPGQGMNHPEGRLGQTDQRPVQPGHLIALTESDRLMAHALPKWNPHSHTAHCMTEARISGRFDSFRACPRAGGGISGHCCSKMTACSELDVSTRLVPAPMLVAIFLTTAAVK